MKLLIHSQNSTAASLKLAMDKYSHHILYNGCNYWFMRWLKLIHANERGSQQKGVRSIEVHVHYSKFIMSTMASQITSLMSVYSTVYSCADERTHQSSASLDFVSVIHRWPVNSPYKGPVTGRMYPFDDVIMSHAFLAVPQPSVWDGTAAQMSNNWNAKWRLRCLTQALDSNGSIRYRIRGLITNLVES